MYHGHGSTKRLRHTFGTDASNRAGLHIPLKVCFPLFPIMESEVTEKVEKNEKLEQLKGRVLQGLHDTFESIKKRVLGEDFVAPENNNSPYVIEWGPMPKGTTSTKKYKLGKGTEITDWSNPYLCIKPSETPDGIGRIYLNEQIAYTMSGKSLETLDEIDRFNFAKAVYSAVSLAWTEMHTTPKPRIKGALTKTAEYNEIAFRFGVVGYNALTDQGERLIRGIKNKLIFPFKAIDFRKETDSSKERSTYKLFMGPNPNDHTTALMTANLSKTFYESKEGVSLTEPKLFEPLGMYIWVEKLKMSNSAMANKLSLLLNQPKSDEIDALVEELESTD